MAKRTFTIGRDYTVSLHRHNDVDGWHWQHITVRLQIDGQAVANQLGAKTLRAKSHKAKLAGGAIVATLYMADWPRGKR